MTTWTRIVESGEGERLDRWLSDRFTDLSRTRIKALVDGGQVRVGGERPKAAYRLKAGDEVVVEIPPPPTEELTPERIALDVVFEDDHVLVVDKPAGMVTHPGAGQRTGTLAAAALAHAPGLAGVGGPRRPGIVHRLDKGTSGLIVLAKTPRAYEHLTAQLARREVARRYLCLAHGRLTRAAGVIEAPIGRDPHSRVRMAVARDGRGRRAVTRFRVLERPGEYSYVECRLETGRTHQIRVHLASLGHPIVGDTTYGAWRAALPPHPETGEHVELESPLPHRIGKLLSHLRHMAERPDAPSPPKRP